MKTLALPEPFIREGDIISAANLNALARAATRRSLAPGQFQSGSLNLVRLLSRLAEAGPAAEVNLKFCAATSSIGAATGWALDDSGGGSFVELDDDGNQVGDELVLYNRYFNAFRQWSPLWVLQAGEANYLINVGCTQGPSFTVT